MIVCDTFAFLHLHKSGGTFINHMMMKCISSSKRIGYHLPYSEMPADYRALPVIGTVRNPWSYYVSWYHFQSGQDKPNPLFRICSEERTLDFDGTIRNLVGLHRDEARVARLIDVFPEHFVNYGLNLRKSCIASISGSGLGFYSFLFKRLYDGAAAEIVAMERLRDDFAKLPLRLSIIETHLVQGFLRSVPNLNVSDHDDYRGYYSQSLCDLVAETDRTVIERFGYVF